MEMKFACKDNILPVLEDKLKAMGCKIEFAGDHKRAGTVTSTVGEFNFSHINGMLFVTSNKEDAGNIGMQLAMKHIKEFIQDFQQLYAS
jgi:hypothetical protein